MDQLQSKSDCIQEGYRYKKITYTTTPEENAEALGEETEASS